MFSGIRSMIFGYTDEPVSANQAAVAGSPGSDVSGVSLGQTLNAATTKFTEQLLPQQASIEELQSSSHQLLPTLNEQQHENELMKSHDLASTEKADENEDEDEINVDSWELLDLIEKKTENNSKEDDGKAVSSQRNTYQQQQQLLKPVGGILKPQEKEQRTKQQQTRQKSKVSFETPDLVKNKHKNERITNNTKPKQDKLVSQSKSKSNKKKNKQTIGKLVLPLEEDVVVVEEDPSLVLFPTSVFPYLAQPTASGSGTSSSNAAHGHGVEPKPKKQDIGLNYAAVLLTKPKEVGDKVEQSSYTAKLNGPVKRNRTVSMSSRSSNDDIDFKDDVDNESLVSSEFSDCDYGYDGLNDYVVRAKKSTKRKQTGEGGSCGNLAHANVLLKRGFAKQTGKVSAASSANSISTEGHKQLKIAKSKKKRVATSVSVSTDFLKQPVLQNRQLSSEVNSNDSSDVAEMDESWYVTPPPCFTGAKKHDADKNPVKTPIAAVAAQENALIEHPSIYIASTSSSTTRAKQDLSTGKKASRKCASYTVSETASASSSLAAPAIVLKRMTKKPFDEVPEKRSKFDDNDNDSWRDTEDEQERAKVDEDYEKTLSQLTEVVGRKASRLRTKSVSQGAGLNLNKSGLAEEKAWRNKFIVDDWDLDDPEDVVSDFDDMFEPVVRKRKSLSGKAKRNKQQQMQHQQEVEVRGEIKHQSKSEPDPVWDDDCDSVEMESVEKPAVDEGIERESLPEDVKENNEPPTQVAAPPEVAAGRAAADLGRKPPIPVRPIEPERKPGWQLRRRRSKRRPLASATGSNNAGSPRPASSLGSSSSGGSSPASSSARSSPSLIDRIGSSIVANLTNLTSGLVSAGPASALDEPANQSAHQQHILAQRANKLSIGPSELEARKQMSKGSLKRQNGLNMAANHSNRRPTRRLRMFACRNGCSINRKVQSNFH